MTSALRLLSKRALSTDQSKAEFQSVLIQKKSPYKTKGFPYETKYGNESAASIDCIYLETKEVEDRESPSEADGH